MLKLVNEKERNNQILFVQGGGKDVHDSWDNKLVASLKKELGAGFAIHYPRMPHEDDPDPTTWKKVIQRELGKLSDGGILVAHSIGAAILIDYLVEGNLERRPDGIFLIALPFIGDQGWPSEELRPTKAVGGLFPKKTPLYLYQGLDDDIVPSSHSALLAKALPQATFRRLEGRDHQLNNNLSEVAKDIKRLKRT